MPRGWQNFDEEGSGQLQGQDCRGPETPRVRKGKAFFSPSTKNCESLARVEPGAGGCGQGLDVPESEVEGRSS